MACLRHVYMVVSNLFPVILYRIDHTKDSDVLYAITGNATLININWNGHTLPIIRSFLRRPAAMAVGSHFALALVLVKS